MKAHFVVQSGSVVHWRKIEKKYPKKERKIEKIRERSEKIAEI